MSRLSQVFAKLQSEKRRGVIPYVVAGDPSPEGTVALMHSFVEAGADVLELGVPFSDPMAEGSVIQKGHERALANGMTLQRVLSMVREFREDNDRTPVVMMGYANPQNERLPFFITNHVDNLFPSFGYFFNPGIW